MTQPRFSDPATRNTLSEQLISAGVEALNVAESNDDIRAVILRGDGAHFCAGGNLNGLASRRQSGPSEQMQMIAIAADQPVLRLKRSLICPSPHPARRRRRSP